VGKACRRSTNDPDELILFTLFKIFKRPIFESELRSAGVTRPVGEIVSEQDANECKKILRRAGNTVASQNAVTPMTDMSEKIQEVLIAMMLDSTDSRHLMAETKQSRLM